MSRRFLSRPVSPLLFVWLIGLYCPVTRVGADEWTQDQAKPTAADELGLMQGQWKVRAVYRPSSPGNLLPEELAFARADAVISIQGNSLVFQDQPVASLANELDLPAQQEELGFKNNRLILLTLPSGKGVLCSYNVSRDQMEFAYTHKCFCHRGSGHVLAFDRIAQSPQKRVDPDQQHPANR